MNLRKHSSNTMILAILFATFGVINGVHASSADPACDNAVPLGELRQVRIAAQGDFDGCVNKSRLRCSLEREQMDDLDNITRHTVARMPDGKCIRVNLVDATMFRLGVEDGRTEFFASQYLNPTKPFPPGYFIFGAMPNKRILYVRARIDRCEEAQGGELSKCKTERDLRLAQARGLCEQQNRLWDNKARDGEECLISASQLAHTTTQSSATAIPGQSPDRATTATTAPSAPGPSPDRTEFQNMQTALAAYGRREKRAYECVHDQDGRWIPSNNEATDRCEKNSDYIAGVVFDKFMLEIIWPLLLVLSFVALRIVVRKNWKLKQLMSEMQRQNAKSLEDTFRICETTPERIADANIVEEVKRMRTELEAAISAARQAGDHSKCVPKANHVDCVSRSDCETAISIERKTLETQHRLALQAADERNAGLQTQLNAIKLAMGQFVDDFRVLLTTSKKHLRADFFSKIKDHARALLKVMNIPETAST